MVTTIDLYGVRHAIELWERVAKENGGWTIGTLQVWVNSDGKVLDSLAVRQGTGQLVVIVDTDDDEEEE
jgi:hypothetical protein